MQTMERPGRILDSNLSLDRWFFCHPRELRVAVSRVLNKTPNVLSRGAKGGTTIPAPARYLAFSYRSCRPHGAPAL
jgi:hypothetical protein